MAKDKYYCDMDRGGTQLLFQRRGGNKNIDIPGLNLDQYLHNGKIGSVDALEYENSYVAGNVDDYL